jgi:hypothetical protein
MDSSFQVLRVHIFTQAYFYFLVRATCPVRQNNYHYQKNAASVMIIILLCLTTESSEKQLGQTTECSGVQERTP